MLPTKDYSEMTSEDLLSAEKKMKSERIVTAVFIGMLIGIGVYAAAHGGIILPVILLIFSYMIGNRQAQNWKSLQAEISRRNITR